MDKLSLPYRPLFAVVRLLPRLPLLLIGLSSSPPAVAACQATEADQLGPYYQPGASFTAELAGPREPGERLVVSGRVLGLPDCKPLPGAVVDVWQASASGQYYSLQPGGDEADRFKLRGRVRTDEQGRYRFDTVLPGHYGLGYGRSRPRHIHFLVSHPGYAPLVTQLYFQGDREMPQRGTESDPRVMPLKGAAGQGYQGSFDIVLEPKSR